MTCATSNQRRDALEAATVPLLLPIKHFRCEVWVNLDIHESIMNRNSVYINL
jgi:hypothetical protein